MKTLLLSALGVTTMLSASANPLFNNYLNIRYAKQIHTKGTTYWSQANDQATFSFLRGANYTSNVRFSYFLNMGFNYNYDISKKVSVFAGLSLKNLGFADRSKDSVYRARNYYFGVPIGIRVGKLASRSFVSLGGGIDIPIHYKTKVWEEDNKRKTKTKEMEWFENEKNNTILPYVFASAQYKGVGLKYSLYLSDMYKAGQGHYVDGAVRNGALQAISIILDINTNTGSKMIKPKKVRKTINNI